MKRLLYLGFAFPPGMQAQFPGVNPAGHAFETQMLAALRAHLEIKSVGVLPVSPPFCPLPTNPASGVAHDLVLLDRAPELWHRFRSLLQLKRQFRRWLTTGWRPNAVLVYNLSPIYNNFLRWLRRQPAPPKLILLLLDSAHLGRTLPRWKRLRHGFKPLVIPDAEMIGEFDACVGLSQAAEKFFAPRGIPFLWMPGGYRAELAPCGDEFAADTSPIRFGYFGALASHSGVLPLAETFLANPLPNELHICGHGKLTEALKQLAARDARLKFHGLLPTPEDCLRLAQSWDVLINPRPAESGNENNFPSKIFEYARCGRAILTTRLGGVDTVLGQEAYYFDTAKFSAELSAQLSACAAQSRAELRRRGMALRERVATHYAWPKQAAAMAEFIGRQL
ncbi:MAG: glycosyltransferase family 4 protein [Verrucomicrobia bacterium]|nr:glycosyltransferase family 4 protein [Verrucomicrobiota bacterium]